METPSLLDELLVDDEMEYSDSEYNMFLNANARGIIWNRFSDEKSPKKGEISNLEEPKSN
jgi:hypothetical protein